MIFEMGKYLSKKDIARERAMLLIAEPKENFAQEVWNLSETTLAKMFINVFTKI
jgi:hypothetical protein